MYVLSTVSIVDVCTSCEFDIKYGNTADRTGIYCPSQ